MILMGGGDYSEDNCIKTIVNYLWASSYSKTEKPQV